jgi:hypothetical protein
LTTMPAGNPRDITLAATSQAARKAAAQPAPATDELALAFDSFIFSKTVDTVPSLVLSGQRRRLSY